MALEVGSVLGSLGARLDPDGFDRFDRRLEKARRDAAKPITANTKVEDDATRELDQFDRRLDKARREALKPIKGHAELEDDASRGIEEVDSRWGRLKRALTRPLTARVDVNADTRGLDRAERQARAANHSLRGAGIGAGVAAAGVTGVGAAAAGAAVGLFAIGRAGATFEKNMSEVKAVTGASADEMKVLEDAARRMGTESGLGAGKAAQAIGELAKGGLTTQQIIGGGLAGALSLANAGGLELADAASGAANALNLFGLDGDQATHVADAFATAANATTADVSDFTMALSQGGSAAKAAGLDFDQTTVALEALAAIGVKNSDAGTSLKSALSQLASPTTQATELMDKLGLSFFDANGAIKPLPAISEMLRDKLGGLTKQQRLQATTTLAGTDGMRALLALYEAGPDKLERFAGGLSKQGTAADVAKEKTNNLTGAGHRFLAVAENISIGLYQKVSPALTTGLDGVTRFVDGMSQGEGAGGRFAARASQVARVVGGVLVTAFNTGKRVISAVSDVVEENRGRLEGIGKTVGGLARRVVGAFGQIIDAARDTFGGNSGTGRDVRNIITQFLNIIGALEKVNAAVVKRILPGIVTAFRGFALVVRGIIRIISGILSGDFGKAWDGVKDIFKGAIKVIGGTLRAGTAPLRTAAAAIGKAIGSAFSSAWGGIVSTARGFVNTIIDVLNVIPGVNIGKVGGNKGPSLKGIENAGSEQAPGGRRTVARRQGGKVDAPIVIMGEEAPEHPEWVIPTNPAYRSRAVGLWQMAGRELGVPGFRHGGRFDATELEGRRNADGSVGYLFGGLNPGKALKFVEGLPGKAADTVAGLASKIVGKLPGNPGGILSGAYSYALGKARDFIGDKAGDLFEAAKSAAAAAAGAGGGGGGGGGGSTTGLVPQVLRAIAWARRHGWHGGISSGFRSFAEQTRLWNNRANNPYPVARPGTSNHESGQAVDVTDPEGFRRALEGAPPGSSLKWFGPGDRVHFSVTGARRGGRLGALGSLGGELLGSGVLAFAKGGKTPKKKTPKPILSAKENSGIKRSINRRETGIASFETEIQGRERTYDQTDRRFGLSDEVLLIENEDGSTTVDEGAVNARVRELTELARQRRNIEATIKRYRARIATLIKTYRDAIASLKRALSKAKGKARQKERGGYRQAISDYADRIKELKGTASDLGFDLTDQRIDLAELYAEREEVKGTKGAAAPPKEPETPDTPAEDAGASSSSSSADATDAPAAATPLEIATAAAEAFSAFTQNRADLFAGFGSNFLSAGAGAAAAGVGQAIANAAGSRFLGAGTTGEAGAGAAAGFTGDQVGERTINIVNNFEAPPPDPHTWTQQTAFELAAAG